MDIKNIKIRNFRGISQLNWMVGGRFVCLIGPGDSTKSTILDAIELALTPRRNVTIDDTDFFNANTADPFIVEITIGEIPTELLSEAKFGYWIRGWDGHIIMDEPTGNDQPLLTIQLTIDESLDPVWLIVNDRRPEGKRISSFDRAKFGISAIRDYSNRQLSWGPGSVLTQLMDEHENTLSVLAEARRQAKASLNPDQLPTFKQSAQIAETIGGKLGVIAKSEDGFVPHLDVRSTWLKEDPEMLSMAQNEFAIGGLWDEYVSIRTRGSGSDS